jgi:hypothetical protein
MDHKDHGVSAFENSVDRLLGSLIICMAIMLKTVLLLAKDEQQK